MGRRGEIVFNIDKESAKIKYARRRVQETFGPGGMNLDPGDITDAMHLVRDHDSSGERNLVHLIERLRALSLISSPGDVLILRNGQRSDSGWDLMLNSDKRKIRR